VNISCKIPELCCSPRSYRSIFHDKTALVPAKVHLIMRELVCTSVHAFSVFPKYRKNFNKILWTRSHCTAGGPWWENLDLLQCNDSWFMGSYLNPSIFWECLVSMYSEVHTNSRIIRCTFAGTRAVLSRKMLQTNQNEDLQNDKIADSNGPNTQLIYANYTQNLKIIPSRIQWATAFQNSTPNKVFVCAIMKSRAKHNNWLLPDIS
jgi:hypothetical protein